METHQAGRLLVMLRDKTEAGRVPWVATEDEDEYQAVFAEYSLRISRKEEGDPIDGYKIFYVLKIFDPNGVMIDDFWSSEIRNLTLELQTYDTETLMKIVFERARSKARGVDVALDKIFEALAK